MVAQRQSSQLSFQQSEFDYDWTNRMATTFKNRVIAKPSDGQQL